MLSPIHILFIFNNPKGAYYVKILKIVLYNGKLLFCSYCNIIYLLMLYLMLPMSKARGFCKAIIEAPFLNYQNYHFLNFLFKSSIPLVFLKKLRKLSIGSCFYFRSTNHSVLIYQR